MATFQALCNSGLACTSELLFFSSTENWVLPRWSGASPESGRPSRELEEELNWVESRYELFTIEFFREYRWCVALNSIVALVLAVLLVVIALKADDQIADGYEWFAVFAMAASYLPAPCILGSLWVDAQRRVKPLKAKADSIEKRALDHVPLSTPGTAS